MLSRRQESPHADLAKNISTSSFDLTHARDDVGLLGGTRRYHSQPDLCEAEQRKWMWRSRHIPPSLSTGERTGVNDGSNNLDIELEKRSPARTSHVRAGSHTYISLLDGLSRQAFVQSPVEAFDTHSPPGVLLTRHSDSELCAGDTLTLSAPVQGLGIRPHGAWARFAVL